MVLSFTRIKILWPLGPYRTGERVRQQCVCVCVCRCERAQKSQPKIKTTSVIYVGFHVRGLLVVYKEVKLETPWKQHRRNSCRVYMRITILSLYSIFPGMVYWDLGLWFLSWSELRCSIWCWMFDVYYYYTAPFGQQNIFPNNLARVSSAIVPIDEQFSYLNIAATPPRQRARSGLPSLLPIMRLQTVGHTE